MKVLRICLFFLCVLPMVAQAEIWAYQIHGKKVSDCTKRPEASIDEVWTNLESASGLKFNIARNNMLIHGYILQNKEHNAEFSFYRSKGACEFGREGVAAYLEDNQEKLKQIKRSRTAEAELFTLSPADIVQEQKQDWVNFFAGCTNGVLKQNTPLKGVLQKVVDHCDCMARSFFEKQG
jgi:hypothetical protein